MTISATAAPAPHASGRRSLLLLSLALAAAAGVLVAVALLLPPEVVRALFAEHGPAESVSLALWVLLGVVVLLVLRPSSRVTIAGFVVCLAAAAREGDLHTAFTGYSVLKIGFYHKPEFPLAHRLIAGVIVLVMIVSVITLGLSVLRSLRATRAARPAWVIAAAVSLALVVFTKVADRSPSILRNAADIHLAEPVLLVMSALEEGLEMVLPLVFASAVILAARQRRALETPGAGRVTSAPGAGILPPHASPRV